MQMDGVALKPRQQMSSVPYSFYSVSAETASIASLAVSASVAQIALNVAGVVPGAVPVGTVLPFAGKTLPSNFLECSGEAVSRTTFSALFAVIGTMYGTGDNTTTFNLPDYRGKFLRGVDEGAGNDPDSASRTGGDATTKIGSIQGDTVGSHNHGAGLYYDQGYSGAHNNYGMGVDTTSVPGAGGMFNTTTTGTGIGKETRPKNVYVMYIIRAQ